jgi:4-aminobutyrate aminotransferase-like enzyme/Ser/Thr protein kinase RdoA (MazF antagonist)
MQIDASRIAKELYGVDATATRLNGEFDDNFHLKGTAEYILKVMRPGCDREFVEMQVAAMEHLGESRIAGGIREYDGRLVWMLHWLPGKLLADTKFHSAQLLRNLGRLLAAQGAKLATFGHLRAHSELKWDLKRASWIRDYLHLTADPALIENVLAMTPDLAPLRHSVIHGDANDHNIIVNGDEVAIIDFGDLHYTATICDLAICCAYVALNKEDPLTAIAHVVSGYHALEEPEIEALFPLILLRLAVSIVNSAHRKTLHPNDAYITISEQPAWEALRTLAKIDQRLATYVFRNPSKEETLAGRRAHLGGNLSISYDEPLKIVRGWKQFLYDDTGREFLDVYNNVPLVGHSHPRVVEAVQKQIALLNTNTRYLHDNIVLYAERLTAKLPAPLKICYFLNSASEANELALRLARAHTGREDIIVLDHAYHGNTTTLIDISPYKFNGPGGTGKKPWVHIAPIPDDYRGPYKRGDPEAGPKYARHVDEILTHVKPAAYIAESLPSVGGQIVFPPGYLSEVYKSVRAAGGVAIADEVQVGFGRLGSHFWGFQMQGVTPDIIVLGKPIGNGFPLAAVITTAEIAASFDNGMEFFSTFGGNPVACAAGLAVLEVLEEERLQENALQVGNHLLNALRAIDHEIIGDLRGSGLFLGIELVRDRATLETASTEASRVVNAMRELGILVGTDGPHHNVIKLRPPLCFTKEDADRLVGVLKEVI